MKFYNEFRAKLFVYALSFVMMFIGYLAGVISRL